MSLFNSVLKTFLLNTTLKYTKLIVLSILHVCVKLDSNSKIRTQNVFEDRKLRSLFGPKERESKKRNGKIS